MSTDPTDDDIERRLSALEEASDRRRAELSAVLHDLPAAVSRRDVVTSAFRDLLSEPGEGSLVQGALRTIARVPRALMARVRSRRSPR